MKITSFNTSLTNAIMKSIEDEDNKRYVVKNTNLSHYILEISYWGLTEIKETPNSIRVLLTPILIKSLGFHTLTAFLHTFLGEKYTLRKKPPKELELVWDGKRTYLKLNMYNYEVI